MLHAFDWWVIAAYTAITVAIGLYFARRASASPTDFFLSGRSLPWWLAGTSIVATSYAADTPLAVTEMVVEDGIAGNWYWWSFAIQGLMVTFLFARFWRRAEILTDVELFELRYSGKGATFLRGFKAFLGGVVANSIQMGWVMLAMATVVQLVLGVEAWKALTVCVLVALTYSVASGLWGVVVTDFLQFGVAMGGSVLLAVYAIQEVGGIQALKEGAVKAGGGATLDLIPSSGSDLFMTFLVFLGVQWWCASNSDSGGGIIVQRLSATRSPKESFLAVLWFNVAHYCLRAWPWILCALAVLILYPNLDEPRQGYPRLILDLLPTGLRGLMLASFLAAFMSTVDTHLNWASSYLINDIYRRFLKPVASPRHYVNAGRLAMILAAVLAAITASFMPSIVWMWKYLTLMGAGAGLVKILRWYWWRINAWSEISAVFASLTFSTFIMVFMDVTYATRLLINVAASAVVWISVTLLTSPRDMQKLSEFYQKVRPPGRFWGPVARQNPHVTPGGGMSRNLLGWLVSVIFVYSVMFATGNLLLMNWRHGAIAAVISIFSGVVLMRLVQSVLAERETLA